MAFYMLSLMTCMSAACQVQLLVSCSTDLRLSYVQVLNATNAEPVGDNETGEQSNLPITALPDVDVVSTTKYVCSLHDVIHHLCCKHYSTPIEASTVAIYSRCAMPGPLGTRMGCCLRGGKLSQCRTSH